MSIGSVIGVVGEGLYFFCGIRNIFFIVLCFWIVEVFRRFRFVLERVLKRRGLFGFMRGEEVKENNI